MRSTLDSRGFLNWLCGVPGRSCPAQNMAGALLLVHEHGWMHALWQASSRTQQRLPPARAFSLSPGSFSALSVQTPHRWAGQKCPGHCPCKQSSTDASESWWALAQIPCCSREKLRGDPSNSPKEVIPVDHSGHLIKNMPYSPGWCGLVGWSVIPCTER